MGKCEITNLWDQPVALTLSVHPSHRLETYLALAPGETLCVDAYQAEHPALIPLVRKRRILITVVPDPVVAAAPAPTAVEPETSAPPAELKTLLD